MCVYIEINLNINIYIYIYIPAEPKTFKKKGTVRKGEVFNENPGFRIPWFHDFHDFHDFLDDTWLCDVDLGNLHFQLEFAVWLSAKATLGPKKPSLALTAAYGWDPKKPLFFFTGFHGLITGFPRVNYGFYKDGVLSNLSKYGFSTG